MNIQEITQSQNFCGQFVKLGKFSNKPDYCLNKIGRDVEKFIKPENFNLYVKQDYSSNSINFVSDTVYPFKVKNPKNQVSIPVTSSSLKYLESALKAVNDYKRYLEDKSFQEYQKKCQKQANKDFFKFMMCLPIVITEMISEAIVPNSADKVEKFFVKAINKLTKKG